MMMKYFGVVLLAAAAAGAADFTTGQAARAVFGQQTFTAEDQDFQTGPVCGTIPCSPTPYILGAGGGVAYANNQLFVADSNVVGAFPQYHRVLIYTNVSALLPAPTEPVNQQPGSNFVRCPLCLGTSLLNYQTFVLGGYPNNAPVTPDYADYGINNQSFRNPTAVASDGNILAVADTNNNRILIWKHIPSSNGQPADLVLGQKDFNTVAQPPQVTSSSFRGPQGVWIQGNRLFVADTANSRVMVWNSIPSSNNQPADYVLGAPNFTTAPQPDLTKSSFTAAANTMASPVSVTSDGTRLFVTDLGNNRVLIWNTIPTQTQQPADVSIGQPDLNGNLDNNSSNLCASNGTDSTGKATYPQRCAATLSFPRFALSTGTMLFVADGGNDRILVFNTIPTQSGQRADAILGQPDEVSDNTSDTTFTFRPDANVNHGAASTIRTPLSLAWDGTNLYAADAFDRRVLVFTPGSLGIPLNGIVNAFSLHVNAIASVDISGTITAGDTATITIGNSTNTDSSGNPITKGYTYTVTKDDTIATITTALANLINNAPDPYVLAVSNPSIGEIVLTARAPDEAGNNITLAVSTTGAGSTSTTTNAATVILTSSGSTLNGGASAGEIAPGSLVTLFAADGATLADAPASADLSQNLPTTLGGVQVYFNGLLAPLAYVSPGQINAQMPYEVTDTNSVSAYVRIRHGDGTVTYTTAVNIPIVLANPGILADGATEPRQVRAFHASSYAVAVVDLEGTAQAGDTATVTIDGHNYSYTVQSSDTSLDNIRDALIAAINNGDQRVTASAAGQFERIILTAKVPGPEGNGISVTVSQSSTVTAGATVALTALQASTCCASVAGAPITQDNPAVPGELITIYATGLGILLDPAKEQATTGAIYQGPQPNTPSSPVDNAQVGGKTANVLFSGLVTGMVGVHQLVLQLDPGLTTNPQTQMYIAQSVFTSNIVTIPVVAPTPPPSQ